jgi:hypothetical protein
MKKEKKEKEKIRNTVWGMEPNKEVNLFFTFVRFLIF